MSDIALLAQGGLPSNLTSLMTTGQVKMKIEPNTKLPQWVMKVYGSGVVTVGVPYMIWWSAYIPTTAAAATGYAPYIGIATETTTAAAWTWVIVAGMSYSTVSTGAIPVGSGVEVLNAGVAVSDDAANGPQIVDETIGHAQAAASGDVCPVWMYGRSFVKIESS